MKEKDYGYEIQSELEEIRKQVSLLLRYVTVLQGKVKDLEVAADNDKYKNINPSSGFSDFGGPKREKSQLGTSIADVTRYPYREK